MEEKKCSRCKIFKKMEEFHNSNVTKDLKQAFCKICNSEVTPFERKKYYNQRRKARRKDPVYRKKELLQEKQSKIKNREKHLWNSARRRAYYKKIPFNIEITDVFIPEFCPILKIKLTKDNLTLGDRNAPSIDKIIPQLGYVKGNIMVISLKANIMKNDATPEELLNFSNFFINYLSN
jgi:hypothetical protein